MLLFFEILNTQKIYFYGNHDFMKRRENVLYFANHQSKVDWIITDMLIARQGGIGRLRFMLHSMLKYIPLFGFSFYQHSFIYVDRTNFSAERSVAPLKYIKKHQLPSWIIIYPEGTRFNPNNTEVIEKSLAYAEKKGLKSLKYHLTPRIRGTEMVLSNLHDYLDAVYDVTVVYADANGRPLDKAERMPDMFSYMNAQHTLHIHIHRIPIAEVPRDGRALEEWLNARFQLKDTLFEKLGAAFSTNKDTDVDPVDRTSEVFANCLSRSKLPGKPVTLPPLKRRKIWPAVCYLFGLTFLLLFLTGWYGRCLYASVVLGGAIFGIPYVCMVV